MYRIKIAYIYRFPPWQEFFIAQSLQPHPQGDFPSDLSFFILNTINKTTAKRITDTKTVPILFKIQVIEKSPFNILYFTDTFGFVSFEVKTFASSYGLKSIYKIPAINKTAIINPKMLPFPVNIFPS